jgi:hypothetical protein
MYCKAVNHAGFSSQNVICLAAVLWCLGSVSAAAPANPVHRSSLVTKVKQLLGSRNSPAQFKMVKEDADRYWDEKREIVRSVESATDEKYPWCDDPDYAVLQHTRIAEMSAVQYDLYRSLRNRCVDATEDDAERGFDECADPRLKELADRPLHDLSDQEYQCYWWLSEKCRDQKKSRGISSDASADSVYKALRTVPITAWSQNEYDYFTHFRQRSIDESQKRTGQPYDYCADSLYLSIRKKQIGGMTDQELDYFIRCRRECVNALINNGYEYSLALDRRYQSSLRKLEGPGDKQRKIFVEDVEQEDEKRSRQKIAAAGAAAAAVIIPTAVPVVLIGIFYLVASVAH